LLKQRDFIDNTPTASLPSITPPENNYIAPTTSRLKRTWKNFTTAGLTSEAFNDSLNHGFKHSKVFRDQLFGVGADSIGVNSRTATVITVSNYYSFSDVLFGSEVYQPDYFPYQWEVGRGDGQKSIGLGVLVT